MEITNDETTMSAGRGESVASDNEGMESRNNWAKVDMPSFNMLESWNEDLNAWSVDAVDLRLSEYVHQMETFRNGTDNYELAKSKHEMLLQRKQLLQKSEDFKRESRSADLVLRAKALSRVYEEVAGMNDAVDSWAAFAGTKGVNYSMQDIDAAKKQFDYFLLEARGAVDDLRAMRDTINDFLFGEESRWKVPRGEATFKHRQRMREACEKKIDFMVALAPLAESQKESEEWEEEFNETVRIRKELLSLQLVHFRRQRNSLKNKKMVLEDERTSLDYKSAKGKKRVSFFSSERIEDRLEAIDHEMKKFDSSFEIIDKEEEIVKIQMIVNYNFPMEERVIDLNKRKGEDSKVRRFATSTESVIDTAVIPGRDDAFNPPAQKIFPLKQESVFIKEKDERHNKLALKIDGLLNDIQVAHRGFEADSQGRNAVLMEFYENKERAAAGLSNLLNNKGYEKGLEQRGKMADAIKAAQDFMVSYYAEILNSGKQPTREEAELLKKLDSFVHENYFAFQTYDIYGAEIDFFESKIVDDENFYNNLSEEEKEAFYRAAAVLIEESRCYMRQASFDDDNPEEFQARISFAAKINRLEKYIEIKQKMPGLQLVVDEIRDLERGISIENSKAMLPELKILRDTLDENVSTLRSSVRFSGKLPDTFDRLSSFVTAADNQDISVIDKSHRPVSLRVQLIVAWNDLMAIPASSPNYIPKKYEFLEKLEAAVDLIAQEKLSDAANFNNNVHLRNLSGLADSFLRPKQREGLPEGYAHDVLYERLNSVWNASERHFERISVTAYETSLYLKMHRSDGSEGYERLRNLYEEIHSQIDVLGQKNKILRQIDIVKSIREGISPTSVRGVPFTLYSAQQDLRNMARQTRANLSLYKYTSKREADLPRLLDIAEHGPISDLDKGHLPYEILERLMDRVADMPTRQAMMLERFDVRHDLLSALREAQDYLSVSKADSGEGQAKLAIAIDTYFKNQVPEDYMDELHRAVWELRQNEKLFVRHVDKSSPSNADWQMRQSKTQLDTHVESYEFTAIKQARDGLRDLIKEVNMYLEIWDGPNFPKIKTKINQLIKMRDQVSEGLYVPKKSTLIHSMALLAKREDMAIDARKKWRDDQVANEETQTGAEGLGGGSRRSRLGRIQPVLSPAKVRVRPGVGVEVASADGMKFSQSETHSEALAETGFAERELTNTSGRGYDAPSFRDLAA